MLSAALLFPLSASAQDYSLSQDQWESVSMTQGRWEAGSVILGATGGAAGMSKYVSRKPLTGDFIAEIKFELLDWQSGVGSSLTMSFGVSTPAQAKTGQMVSIGREWIGALDEYRALAVKGAQIRTGAGVIDVEKTGRLRILRRGGQVRAAFQVEGGWHTLQIFDMYKGEPLALLLTASNAGPNAVNFPPVRVRFSDLKVENLPPLSGGSRPGAAPPEPGKGWVIYSTEPGWLHIGSEAEFKSEQKVGDEIFGGNSEVPLKKTAIQAGFASREEAIKFLGGSLTKVHIRYFPTVAPHEIARAVFGGKEYYLRLAGGSDPEALTRAENYDLAAEKKILADLGLTPRVGFGYLWLIHITGHGIVDGGVRDDKWITYSSAPRADPARPGTAGFTMSDGLGGTVGYSCDKWEGPYRDNYGMARAMKRIGITDVALWPPGSTYTRTITASEVPESPRDYGPDALGLQPIVDAQEMREWVVYVTGGVWLHVGTRSEFEYPVKSSETLWAGPGDEVMQRISIPIGGRMYSYEQAMGSLCKKLSAVKAAFHPTAEPKETLSGALNGKVYQVQLARNPDALVAGYGSYNYGAEVDALRRYGLVPVKKFKKQWLVHANAVGTSNGPQKRDLWMMVGTQPANNRVEIPDGNGGSFGFALDAVEGPFEDSKALSASLKSKGLKSIHIYGEDRDVTVEEASPPPDEGPPEKPEILSITPDKGEPGQTFYITVVAKGMKPGYRFRFGPGVTVTDETSLGKNPDGPGERWLATISIDKDATFNAGR